ncbi:chorismate lyase [Vibrio sp. FNV 38]|nr:chorismate lyase [Vibrio sp. FNV 38]
MELSVTKYLQALREVEWQSPEVFDFSNSLIRDWLTEQGSLSLLLENYCHELTVELLQSDMKGHECLSQSESKYLPNEEYLLRKVILKGDQTSWVLGRTLIPSSSLFSDSHDLVNQGETPLGLTVFKNSNVSRDSLQVARVIVGSQQLLARRSRLWVEGKPLLVAELFLPLAPIYVQGSKA